MVLRVYVLSSGAAAAAWALGWAAASRVELPLAPWAAGSERAIVDRVVDGDTIVLADGRTVRILGVDAPETSNPAMAGPQPLGAEAAQHLRALVQGREVVVERDVADVDHYGRLLRHVWLGHTLVAEALVAEGLAWSSTYPTEVRHKERLRAAEERARAASRGLWGTVRATPLPVFVDPTGRADGR
jgi:endonuclease YncB( thermonuclease family)